MNEETFKVQLKQWRMKVRDVIVPTTAAYMLYGHREKTRVISKEHEDLIYACVKRLENPSDELYKDLTERLKYDDVQVLEFLHKQYEGYLKEVRKKILVLQKEWSRNYCQFRANQIIEVLEYDSILPICDLVNERIVPIELVLKTVFNVDSSYGDHRRKKDKSEVHIDPRVLKHYNDKKENASRTITHTEKS